MLFNRIPSTLPLLDDKLASRLDQAINNTILMKTHLTLNKVVFYPPLRYSTFDHDILAGGVFDCGGTFVSGIRQVCQC
jgi:hypothetical protein